MTADRELGLFHRGPRRGRRGRPSDARIAVLLPIGGETRTMFSFLSKLLAERYNGQPKDLLYKIYVKYLPLRKVS